MINMIKNRKLHESFHALLKTDGWTIPQAVDCLKKGHVEGKLDEEEFGHALHALLAW